MISRFNKLFFASQALLAMPNGRGRRVKGPDGRPDCYVRKLSKKELDDSRRRQDRTCDAVGIAVTIVSLYAIGMGVYFSLTDPSKPGR